MIDKFHMLEGRRGRRVFEDYLICECVTWRMQSLS